MSKIKSVIQFFSENFFERIFSAWFLSSAVILIGNSGDISLESTNLLMFMFIFIPMFAVMNICDHYIKGIVRLFLVFSILSFSVVLLMTDDSIYTFIALAVFFCIGLHNYFNHKEDSRMLKISPKLAVIFIAVCFVAFFSVVTAKSVLRYLNYAAPNYDFGIFCNMYYNMKTSFAPVTTCERDELLSHFAVHFSPALYIFLPIYYIFPSPVTVAVCQTAAIYSGLIPFVLIMRKKGIEPVVMCLMSVAYMANTVFSMGCSYDFHENCLLVPFILWMIYFYEKRKYAFLTLFALLTLTVKEDAFIYVAVFAAFILVANKDFKIAVPLAITSVAYFAFACWYINNYGLGIMEGRFDAMINGDEGLFGIIKTLLANLGYSVSLIFKTDDASSEKLFYLMYVLLPLGLIPFFTKKPSRLILLLPVFLNLLTDYGYQYDIKFQYSFGITALLFYACILNISEMEPKKRSFASSVAAGLSVMLFFMLFFPTFVTAATRRAENREMYDEMDAVLSEIEDDAVVCCSTFLLPHLADREEIYEVYYTDHTDFDYIILDFRSGYKTESLKFAEKFEELGYEMTDSGSEYIAILVKSE